LEVREIWYGGFWGDGERDKGDRGKESIYFYFFKIDWDDIWSIFIFRIEFSSYYLSNIFSWVIDILYCLSYSIVFYIFIYSRVLLCVVIVEYREKENICGEIRYNVEER